MIEKHVYESELDFNHNMTDKAIGILAITGMIAITGVVLYGTGRIAYKISETIINKIGDKILGPTEDEA